MSHQMITSTIGNYEAILTQDFAIQANIHQSIIVLLIQMKLSARNRRQISSGLKSSDKWSAWFALWIVACRASPLVSLPHHRILEAMVQSRPWHRNVTSFIGEKMRGRNQYLRSCMAGISVSANYMTWISEKAQCDMVMMCWNHKYQSEVRVTADSITLMVKRILRWHLNNLLALLRIRIA